MAANALFFFFGILMASRDARCVLHQGDLPWDFPPGFKDSVLWNGMVVPLLHTTMKGAIWYQGSSSLCCRSATQSFIVALPQVKLLTLEFHACAGERNSRVDGRTCALSHNVVSTQLLR